MKKNILNRKLFAVHSWLGLALGIFYLLISLSGATIVFVNELSQWLYGDDIKVEQEPGKKKISYDKLFEIAQKEFSGVRYFVVGHDAHYPENASFVTGVYPRPHKIFEPNLQYAVNYVNPYTSEVIFETNSSGKGDVVRWLIGFHDSFRLGAGGELFVTIVALAMLLSLITGFIVYRKSIVKVLSFRVKIKFKNWRTASSDLHRVIGTWALIINFLIFFSGLYLYKNYFITDWWKEYTAPKTEASAKKLILNLPPKTTSLDSIAIKAQKLIPEMNLESIEVECDDSLQMISVVGTTKEKLFGDLDNYAIVNFNSDGTFKDKSYKKWEDLNTSEKFDAVNFGLLHTGWALGTIGKIIWTIMGFTPAFLSITGFMLWWRRKIKCNKKLKHNN